jgi:hypothetical protein
MEVIKNLLQKYPEIAVFLTLAIGFLVGKLKFGKFSLAVGYRVGPRLEKRRIAAGPIRKQRVRCSFRKSLPDFFAATCARNAR